MCRIADLKRLGERKETILGPIGEAIGNDLRVMDMTAFALCEENSLPIVVFNMNKQGNLARLLQGEDVGTLVSN